MKRLRALFLAPTASLMAVTMLAPLVIVCVYSFLSRGAYGGVERPFYDEANSRFVDYNHGAYIDESFDTSEYVDALKILGFRNLSREKIFDALLAYAYRDKRTV